MVHRIFSTSFTAAKSNKGESGGKFNAMITDEVITTNTPVQRNDVTLSQGVTKMLNYVIKHGFQVSSLLLVRG